MVIEVEGSPLDQWLVNPTCWTLVSFVENQKMMRGFSSQPHPPVEPQNQKTAARQFFVFLADSKIGNPKIV
jgi:hypothetical protein